MRTKIVLSKFNLYKYNELSEQAKETVKEWYLNGKEPCIFTDYCLEDLKNTFGDNDLKVQYSLNSCQGDGLNIYGSVNVENIIHYLKNCPRKKHENVLTNEEIKTLLLYNKWCSDISLQYNLNYSYSLADRIEFAEEWKNELEWMDSTNENVINISLLEKFEKLVRDIFTLLCKEYESDGYDYFYETSEEELTETCEANEWEFLEDGSFYN